MDFSTYHSELHENTIDIASFVKKYEAFGQKLKEFYRLSSHEDNLEGITMANYYNSGVIYKFKFKSLNKKETLRKVLRLIRDKIFLIKPAGDTSNGEAIVVEVVYYFKTIQRLLDNKSLEGNNELADINI